MIDDDDDDDGPLISFDLQVEFYLKGRPDPVWSQMQINVSPEVIPEIGMQSFMELCLEDFLIEVNQKSSSFVVMRSSSGVRQVFWADSIQCVSLLVPDAVEINKLIEGAVDDG